MYATLVAPCYNTLLLFPGSTYKYTALISF
jgi:hypothetical protein